MKTNVNFFLTDDVKSVLSEMIWLKAVDVWFHDARSVVGSAKSAASDLLADHDLLLNLLWWMPGALHATYVQAFTRQICIGMGYFKKIIGMGRLEKTKDFIKRSPF